MSDYFSTLRQEIDRGQVYVIKFSGTLIQQLPILGANRRGEILNICSTSGGYVSYTLDGSNPTPQDPRVNYSGGKNPFIPIPSVTLNDVRLVGSSPVTEYFIIYLIYDLNFA